MEREFRSGRYRSLRTLGTGSTGTVFEALEEGDGFSRKVAIKMIAGGAVAELPLRETRILARLEHPGIAQLYDAGFVSGWGRFLVMEYVEGAPCTEWADARQLGERERLELFLQICAAVHYANGSLVIHCDLKPSNVMVTSTGRVKLLDFGISRLLSDPASGGGETRTRFYTADYASPEQMLGKPLTVATDVYSLGALLCHLVGGHPPRRTPSAPADAAAIPLRGDLERIARKAMREEAAERYASVAELAADIRRYLRGDAVEAAAPGALLRLRKLATRHRKAVLALALAAAALVAFTAVALRQRQRAEGRFDEVRSLARFILFDLHDRLQELPGSLGARHLLVNLSLDYLNRLSATAAADDRLQLDVARGYVRLADIEGLGNEPSMGRSGQAVNRIEEAERIIRAVMARNGDELESRRALYILLDAQTTGYTLRGDTRAVPAAEEMLRLAQRNLAERPGDETLQEEEAYARTQLASAYGQSKTLGAQSAGKWELAVAAWKDLLHRKPDSVLRKRELARAHQFLAGVLVRTPDKKRAREEAELAYQMHKELEKVPGEDVTHMLGADVGLLAVLYAQAGQFAQAIPMFEEQLRIREGLVANDPNDFNARMGVGATLNRIGTAHMRLKQYERAVPYLERALATQRQVHAQDRENVLSNREMLYVLTDLTETFDVLRRPEASCRYAAEGVEIMRGPIARTVETPTDAAKKKMLTRLAQACGVKF